MYISSYYRCSIQRLVAIQALGIVYPLWNCTEHFLILSKKSPGLEDPRLLLASRDSLMLLNITYTYKCDLSSYPDSLLPVKIPHSLSFGSVPFCYLSWLHVKTARTPFSPVISHCQHEDLCWYHEVYCVLLPPRGYLLGKNTITLPKLASRKDKRRKLGYDKEFIWSKGKRFSGNGTWLGLTFWDVYASVRYVYSVLLCTPVSWNWQVVAPCFANTHTIGIALR